MIDIGFYALAPALAQEFLEQLRFSRDDHVAAVLAHFLDDAGHGNTGQKASGMDEKEHEKFFRQRKECGDAPGGQQIVDLVGHAPAAGRSKALIDQLRQNDPVSGIGEQPFEFAVAFFFLEGLQFSGAIPPPGGQSDCFFSEDIGIFHSLATKIVSF